GQRGRSRGRRSGRPPSDPCALYCSTRVLTKSTPYTQRLVMNPTAIAYDHQLLFVVKVMTPQRNVREIAARPIQANFRNADDLPLITTRMPPAIRPSPRMK